MLNVCLMIIITMNKLFRAIIWRVLKRQMNAANWNNDEYTNAVIKCYVMVYRKLWFIEDKIKITKI